MAWGFPRTQVMPIKGNAYGRVPSRDGKDAAPPCSFGQGGSCILPLFHAGQAAGSRFHFPMAFMEGGSGALPLLVKRIKEG